MFLFHLLGVIDLFSFRQGLGLELHNITLVVTKRLFSTNI